ncbi:MAG: trehalase family glycosidase [Anaerolineae bacterium]|nr:trehalase family glycosidase [Anaerolineae bacterium]
MLDLALDRVPFSFFGSPLAISLLTGRNAPGGIGGIYLRAFHGDPRPVMRIVPLRDGQPAEADAHPQIEALRLTDRAGGQVEICFDGPLTLRLRGRGGLGLRLEGSLPLTLSYALGERLITMIAGIVRRYQVESLAGRLRPQGLWNSRRMGLQDGSTRPAEQEQVAIDLLPDAGGQWEAAIDEFTSTWVPRARADFEGCLRRVRADFERWLAGMPPAPPQLAPARRVASYVDWCSVVAPEGFLRRPAMFMSKNWMANVWGWDHCFNAMALVRGHPDLAWDQLWVIADHQDEYGAYPDTVNAAYVQYSFTESPVHGWTVTELWRRNPEAASDDRLRAAYGTLERWTNWWLRHRRLPGQALAHYLAWDSGWDNSTLFDEGVPLLAPDLAAYLVVQMDALQALAQHLQLEAEAQRWQVQADTMLEALLGELWRGDRFVAKLALEGRVVEADTLQTCMPILLGARLPEAVRARLAQRIEWFLTEHGLASEHPSSAKYSPDGYWRGPIWAPATYIAVCGLERSGYGDLARRIAERFCATCARSGFAENLNALTGEPLRDPAYTWTASVFLLLAERLAGG